MGDTNEIEVVFEDEDTNIFPIEEEKVEEKVEEEEKEKVDNVIFESRSESDSSSLSNNPFLDSEEVKPEPQKKINHGIENIGQAIGILTPLFMKFKSSLDSPENFFNSISSKQQVKDLKQSKQPVKDLKQSKQLINQSKQLSFDDLYQSNKLLMGNKQVNKEEYKKGEYNDKNEISNDNLEDSEYKYIMSSNSSRRSGCREQYSPIITTFQICQKIQKLFTYTINKSFKPIASSASEDYNNHDEYLRLLFGYLNQINSSFTFKGFEAKTGNYGVVGQLACNLEGEEKTVIFKFSNKIDYLTDHEANVLKDLNKLRGYLPHFVSYYGAVTLPIPEILLTSSNVDVDPFSSTPRDDIIPQRVLFQEYIKGDPFYSIILKNNRHLTISQLLHIMLGLEIGQNKIKLTHYDPHIDNILLSRCLVDDLFLYRIKDRFYLVPTYGYYPRIFDVGLSYSKSVSTKNLYSNITNYHYGFQSSIFDPLHDIHHLLLSTFYILEKKSEAYSALCNLIKAILSPLPIWRKRGWKQLPHNFQSIILKKVLVGSRQSTKDKGRQSTDDKDRQPTKDKGGEKNNNISSRMPSISSKPVYSDKFFIENDSSILSIINGLISLPFTPGETSFSLTNQNHERSDISNQEKEVYIWDVFYNEFNILIRGQEREHKQGKISDEKKLYLLKVIVDIIRKTGIDIKKEDIETHFDNSENVLNFRDVRLRKLSSALIFLSKRLSANYYYLLRDHQDLLNKKYKEVEYNGVPITSPLDFYLILSKNLTPNFKIERTNNIYFWDSDNESYSVLSCESLTSRELMIINTVKFNDKGEELAQMLKLT